MSLTIFLFCTPELGRKKQYKGFWGKREPTFPLKINKTCIYILGKTQYHIYTHTKNALISLIDELSFLHIYLLVRVF